jgi:hypothetical protein
LTTPRWRSPTVFRQPLFLRRSARSALELPIKVQAIALPTRQSRHVSRFHSGGRCLWYPYEPVGWVHFSSRGHATRRLRLKRPGYEIDIDHIIAHAKTSGCFFEINSSPDRLDVSADNARRAAEAGVMVAVSTDAHSMGELRLVQCGIDQARRAGLEKSAVLNCRAWKKLHSILRRPSTRRPSPRLPPPSSRCPLKRQADQGWN